MNDYISVFVARNIFSVTYTQLVVPTAVEKHQIMYIIIICTHSIFKDFYILHTRMFKLKKFSRSPIKTISKGFETLRDLKPSRSSNVHIIISKK